MKSENKMTSLRLRRGQIDVMEMPVKLDCNYKYFFVYEDQISKFVVLKGLCKNTANEVALKLIDILAIIGPPQVLQSNNGRKFAEEVVQELRLLWNEYVILHGEICENKTSRDFKNLLERWIEKNPTTTWHEALRHIQIFENTTFRCENGKIPYDILFGKNIFKEIQKLTGRIHSGENIWTEEEWINLTYKNQEFIKVESSKEIVENSTTMEKENGDNSKGYECDSYGEVRNELEKDAFDFKFVDVKDETLNVQTEIVASEDELVERENLLSAEDQPQLQCKICRKQYMKLGHLKNHMRTHMKNKRFLCKVCNKTFHVLNLYEKHMRQSHRRNKLSNLSRKRRSKDTQDESILTIKANKLSVSPDSNTGKLKSSIKDENQKTRKGAILAKADENISDDNRSMKLNGDSTLDCSYCNQKFNFPSVLKRHMRSHTNERPYICETCNKSFKQLGHLSQHSLTHKDYRSFHCAVCGIKFESLGSLKVHTQSHKEDYISKTKDAFRLFECENCKKVFTTKSVLERHILTHSHERQFACLICGKRFKQAGHVKSHMLVHTGERKFECTICKKRFSLSNSLKKHMYVHNGEKPYQCDVCGARFLEKRNLNGHLMTHTNERPFRCKICGKRYTLADTLRRHISAAHEDGRMYQCEICAKMFKQLAHLSVHKKVHNDERPFQCHLCAKNFKHKNVLKSHLAIHANVRPFECDECKATFVRKTNLQTHIASAHMNERPYVCTICGKRFKQVSHLNGHVVVHSNVMPYQCDFCERRCNRLDNLKKHMRLHTKNKE